MGLFTKMDTDGLPVKFSDLVKETYSKKADKDPVYKRRVLEKVKQKGVERWQAGQLGGRSDLDNTGGEVGQLIRSLEKLQNCYAEGEGGGADAKAAFACLLLRKELMEEYCKENRLALEDINNIPYMWQEVARHYASGDGCEKDNRLFAKYITMAFQGWNKSNDEYGVSGAGIIRDLMMGYPYPSLPIETYMLMAASLRSRGAERGAYVMQEIESMSQMVGEVSYKRLGVSRESDLAILKKAADMGNAFANYVLGKRSEDEKEKMAYLEKAANSLADAANELHWVYSYKEKKTNDDYTTMRRIEKIEKERQKEALAKYSVDYAKNFKEVDFEDLEVVEDVETEEEYKGRLGFTDNEWPFTILDLPDEIIDVYQNVYHKLSVSANSADYADHGIIVTIHVSDINLGGRSARNNFGYFRW